MSITVVPKGYKPENLSLYETQTGIGFLKKIFETKLCEALNLKRVSAPLFVDPNTGLNDDLSGIERPVSFDIAETGKEAVVVHSLAKWKRLALHRYGFAPGEGLYTDMNAIRRDEVMDNIHSIYTDQWDWEKVITKEDRNVDYLKANVSAQVKAMYETHLEIKKIFPQIDVELCEEVSFITAQELEDLYPKLSPDKREYEYLKKHKTAFIMQIGADLKSGIPHDDRAPDYDDWSLNGDILFWNELLSIPFEISSMGIRVDSKSLDAQLKTAKADEKRSYPFHKMLLNDELPLTIGGGIGQSRLSMLLLGKAHIGEVQVSIWDDKTQRICKDAGIKLL